MEFATIEQDLFERLSRKIEKLIELIKAEKLSLEFYCPLNVIDKNQCETTRAETLSVNVGFSQESGLEECESLSEMAELMISKFSTYAETMPESVEKHLESLKNQFCKNDNQNQHSVSAEKLKPIRGKMAAKRLVRTKSFQTLCKFRKILEQNSIGYECRISYRDKRCQGTLEYNKIE
jgi:hypothetical protein